MTAVLNDRRDFTLANLKRVAWQGERLMVSDAALNRIDGARASFMALVESDRNQFIYGTTTRGGEGARNRLSPEEQRANAQRPRLSAGQSFGDMLPERVARAIVFARLANFIEGNGKVRASLVQRIADMLDGPVSQVPSRGTTWSGETTVPGRLFGHLFGPELEEGENMALINGSCASAGIVADAALRAQKRVRLVEQVMALSIEGLNAPLEAYDPVLKDLWGDPHDGKAIERLNTLLAGCRTQDRRDYQAPVSWRIIPRVLGQVYRAEEALVHAAETSFASVSDNPVYILPDTRHPLGRAFSTGGYHNGMAYPALDWVAQAWTDMQVLADRQTTAFSRGHVSLLPDNLVKEGQEGTAMRMGMNQVQWGEEIRQMAQPTFIPMSEGGGTAQNDTPNPGMIAFRKEAQVGEMLDASMAILAVTASQALWVTEREPAPMLRPLLAAVRRIFPPVESFRDPGADCERLWHAITGAMCDPDPDVLVGDADQAHVWNTRL